MKTTTPNFPRVLLLPAAIFQVAGSALPRIYDWGVDVGARSNALDTAIVPAGWAFTIWGIIFLWSLAFGMYAITAAGARSNVVSAMASSAAVAFLMNGVWALYVPFFNIDIISIVIISIGAVAAIRATLIAKGAAGADLILAKAPLALTAGWLTAATYVGASSVLLLYGVEITTSVLLMCLTGAVLSGVLVIMRGAGPIYAFPLLWALAGVISKNANTNGEQAITIAAAIGALIIAVAVVMSSRRKS